MEKVLVSGSNGYIGRVVFELLKLHGYNPEPLKTRLEEIPPKSLDFTCIIHCAGALRHRISDLYSSNVLGTEYLVDGIANSKCKIIYLSSRAVYAQSNLPLNEDSALSTSTDMYGESKLRAERIISQSGFPHLILRPTNVYGLGVQNLSIGFPTKALMRFILREPVILHYPDRHHDFIYVWDLAKLILLGMKDYQLSNVAINMASNPSSLHKFIKLLADIFERKTSITTKIEILQGPKPRNAIMDNTLLKEYFTNFLFTEPEIVFSDMVDYKLQEQYQ